MFENIIGQPAVSRLAEDIAAASLSPSMLFRGPEASGKGTAALELARVLSCQASAGWNCSCPPCARHRLLHHPDLLAIGPRDFSPEIAAAARVFAGAWEEQSARLLFIRSLRKLLLRFDPVLQEDDARAKKAAPLVEAIDADLDEILHFHETLRDAESSGAAFEEPEEGWAEKIGEAIQKNAWRLESECVPLQTPVDHVRRASRWCRMAPLSKRKLLLVENADRMQDGARNALLKILEEPPGTVVIVLCSARPAALLPTVISRLRPYHFSSRSAAPEREVIRRVFRDLSAGEGEGDLEGGAGGGGASFRTGGGGNLIRQYLNGFLPLPPGKLDALAAFFVASVAGAALARPETGRRFSPFPSLAGLFGYAAPLSRAGGLEPAGDAAASVSLVMEKAEGFAAPGSFSRFLAAILSLSSQSRRAGSGGGGESGDPAGFDALAGILGGLVAEASLGAGNYNLSVNLLLERMVREFPRRCAALCGYP